MKKFILFTFLFFIYSSAWASTWYVRDGGGTPSQCWGQTNATYPAASGVVVAAATNLHTDASNNLEVTSATHNFIAADVGGIVKVTSGTGWTPGYYTIGSVSSNAAILNSSPAAVNTANGHWLEVEPCAINHPNWAWGAAASSFPKSSSISTSGFMGAGDTLDIVGDSDTTWDFTVSGIAVAPMVGDEYTNNGQIFTVTVVNLNGSNNASGSGVMSLSSGIGLAPTSSGTLVLVSGHGSGDSNISFTATAISQAQYMIGLGMPNIPAGFVAGSASEQGPPLGFSSSLPTKVIGIGNHQPQLWGKETNVVYLSQVGPPASGSFTVASGSGDSTISYSANSNSINFAPSYIFYVSGISVPPAIGDHYKNNGATFVIEGVHLSAGSGVLITTDISPTSGNPQFPGTLTVVSGHGSGDATIQFNTQLYGDYNFSVSGITTAPLPGDVYVTNGVRYDVLDTALTGGTGAIAFNVELNVDIENLEITDHSSCSSIIPNPNPGYSVYSGRCGVSGPTTYAGIGIYMAGSNITTKNLWVHGMGTDGIFFMGNVSNWSTTNDKFIGNASYQDDGGTMTFGGNNTMTNDVWAFGGVAEKYPVPDPANYRDINNYLNACDQGIQNGPGGGACLGGGFMMQYDGAQGPCGNWTINGSNFLYNMKTNIDLLHCDGTGTLNMYRSISEGSTGEALKVQMHTVNVEESQLIGNAAVWSTSPFIAIKAPYTNNGSAWNYQICRGQAVTIFQTNPGMSINYLNDDVEGNCVALIISNGSNCSGTNINLYNTKFFGGYDWFNHKTLDWYYDGTSCGGSPITITESHNSIYNLVGNSSGYGCSATHAGSDLCVDPKLIFEVGTQIPYMVGPTAYYTGTNLASELYLQQTSPLIGAGSTTGVTYTNGSTNDINNYANQNTPPAIDMGSEQYGSPDACLSIGSGCTVGSNCCSQYCISGVCSYCIPSGQSASQASNCCSDLISGGICQQYICGDGIVTSPEVCDTSGPNLNNQTCASQGYAGGSLSCNSNCLSFNTSSCTPRNVQVSGKVRFSGSMSIN